MLANHIAWAAGLFEGEGCMSKRSKGNSYRMILSMNDYDVVRRFHEAVGVGSLSEFRPHVYKDHWKTQLRWYLGTKKEIRNLLIKFLPYFGDRRAHKALDILDVLECSS